MAHAISASYVRFNHMSPTAAGMAATLHLLAALALVWGTPLKNFEVPEQAIDVTMEEPPAPKAETPPPPQTPPTPPAAQAQPAPPPPAKAQPLGLPPVEAKPTTTDKTKSLPLGLPPPSERSTEPPQQAAAAPPPPKPEPQPTPAEPAETKLPPVEVPPAPLSMQDFVRAAPPPPPQEIVRPQPRVQPSPPPQTQTPTVQQHAPPQLQPSPLHTQQPQQPQSQASAALVNPADAVARTRIAEDYLWQVGRKMSEHRMFAAASNEQGNVILRLTIARDGRLMDVGVARSSGSNTLDSASLALARAASPYPPLPPELIGNQVTFILPLNYKKYD